MSINYDRNAQKKLVRRDVRMPESSMGRRGLLETYLHITMD